MVQGDPADELNIEMAQPKGPDRCFPDKGERLGQQVIQGFSVGSALLEFSCFAGHARICQLFHFRFQIVDALDHRGQFLQSPVIAGPEDLGEKIEYHVSFLPAMYLRLNVNAVKAFLD
jgi:hypothetical protein